jgi:hypothetical protein
MRPPHQRFDPEVSMRRSAYEKSFWMFVQVELPNNDAELKFQDWRMKTLGADRPSLDMIVDNELDLIAVLEKRRGEKFRCGAIAWFDRWTASEWAKDWRKKKATRQWGKYPLRMRAPLRGVFLRSRALGSVGD